MSKNTLSKESSKKLFDLGLRLKTEKYWINNCLTSTNCKTKEKRELWYPKYCYDVYPAPSVGELMEQFPTYVTVDNKDYYFGFYQQGGSGAKIWAVAYSEPPWNVIAPYRKCLVEYCTQQFLNQNLSEALFLMLEYLINNNLMEVK